MVKSEVEREVLALILVTIIIVSLLGTWAILGVIDQKQARTIDNYYAGGAQVSLVILPSPNEQQQQLSQPTQGDSS